MTSLIGFAEPLFLWGLLVAGIVLLVHLLRRPRFRTLAFSTLRFFSDAAVKHSRSRALRKLLLLITRLLIVILITLLFAGPYLRNDPLRILLDPSRDVCIWIDPTLSMEYREHGTSIAQKAASVVDSLLQCLDNRIAYRLSAAVPEIIPVDHAPLSASQGAPHSFTTEALEKACTKARDDTRRPIVLMLSDFQEPSTNAVETVLSGSGLQDLPVLCIPFTPQKPWNCSVGKTVVMQGREPLLMTRLKLTGDKTCTGTLRASVDGKQSVPIECTLAPHHDTSITFPAPGTLQSGWGSVSLRADDPLQFDNNAYFTVNSRGTVSVLVVGSAADNYPLTAALAVLSSPGERSTAICTHETLTRETIYNADIILVSGGPGAGRSLRMIQQTPAQKKQVIITALDSFGVASAGKEPWRSVQTPLSVLLVDTLSMVWNGFSGLQCTGVAIYGYAHGGSGTPLLTLANREALASFTDDTLNRMVITIGTPLSITTANNLCETGFYLPFIDRLFRFAESALYEQSDVWIAGKPIKNPYYGSKSPVAVLDSAGKQIVLLQQQDQFIIDNPGVYSVVRPDAPPKWTIVIPDTIESNLVYRTPDLHPSGATLRKTVTPDELLRYCTTQHKGAGWVIPWIVLATLFGIELFLRDAPVTKPKNLHT